VIKREKLDGRAFSTYGERRDLYRFLVGNPRERDHLEDPGVDGRIMLKSIFRKWDLGTWTGSSWLRKGTDSGHL
jgi:hypothetical protein